MNTRTNLYIACTVALLSACSVAPNDVKVSNVRDIEFNYVVEGGPRAGVIQTFEMGGNTTIQFKDIENRNLEFINSKSKTIPFKIVGQYAVLEGVQNDFLAISNSATARVVRKSSIVPGTTEPLLGQDLKSKITTASGAEKREIPALASQEYLQLEIARVQTELAEIKRMLGQTTRTPAPEARTQIAQASQEEVVRIGFKDNSSSLEIPEATKPALIVKARKAASIQVKGYTDGSIANQSSESLARSRAAAAKEFLVKNGIPETKINTSFVPAGGFIADNKTKSGRDQNRRVEIAMM